MKTLTLTKGLPGSGKTTWAKEEQKKDSNLVRVNKDELRSMLHNSVHSKGSKVRDKISIDKIIPEKGYVEGNVVLCTNRVNTIKSDLSLEEMKEWIPSWYQKVVEIWRSKGLSCFQVNYGDF